MRKLDEPRRASGAKPTARARARRRATCAGALAAVWLIAGCASGPDHKIELDPDEQLPTPRTTSVHAVERSVPTRDAQRVASGLRWVVEEAKQVRREGSDAPGTTYAVPPASAPGVSLSGSQLEANAPGAAKPADPGAGS